MKGLWLSGFKRAFLSKWYFLSIIGTVIMCYISARDYIGGGANSVYVIELMINLGMFKKVIVFFAAIPYATAFCQDYNSGYINFVVSRSGVRSYILSNTAICVVSGFSAVFLGIMSFWGILSFFYPPQTYEAMGVYSNTVINNPVIYILIVTSIFSLYAAMWTASGLSLSSIIPDKYVALGSPLILGYLLEEITYRFPPYLNLYQLSHPGIEVFGKSAFSNYFYTISVFIFVIVILGYIFSCFVKRRIKNEMV